jgi:Rho-binding antiterminator
MPAKYHPISCDFHDSLEALATSRQLAHIRFLDSSGILKHRNAAITDVFSRDGAEYLVISTGEILRLDQLVAVNGTSLPDNPGFTGLI